MILKRQVIALALFVFVFIGLGCTTSLGDKNKWKAVFLTSGQVYYGKLSKAQGQFYKLEDVYYIRLNQNPVNKDKPDVSLIKLGTEIHGPQDAIYLNRDHILYIEDLKEDGQLVKAIADAKKGPPAAGQAPAPDATMPSVQPNTTTLPPDQAEQFRQFQKFLEAQKIEKQKK
jgi:hypothetical protein